MKNNCTINTLVLAITLVTTASYIIDKTLISFYGFVYIFTLIISVVFIALAVKHNHYTKHRNLQ